MTGKDARPVVLGVVTAAHGIRGQVRIRSFTADPLDIASYGAVSAADGRSFSISKVSLAKDQVVASLSGVSDRNGAEALRGTELSVPRDRLPDDALEEDEFFIEDLVGLAVHDENGAVTGHVVSVQNFGADDVLEVQGLDGKRVFHPFTRAVVPLIDVDAGHVVVIPPSEITVAPEGSKERLADPDAADDHDDEKRS